MTEARDLREGENRPHIGMPAWLMLDQWGVHIADAFGHHPYLVGSATRTKDWRDVDVRLILPDDEFDRLFGPYRKPRYHMALWNAMCCAFSAWGAGVTGLPIDFQIDRETQANEEYGGGRRHALGLRPVYEENPTG